MAYDAASRDTIQDGPTCVTVTYDGNGSTTRETLLRWFIGEREAASSM